MLRLRSPRKWLSGCRKICPSPVRIGQAGEKSPFLFPPSASSFDFLARTLVRETGVEPARPFGHKILSLARLPVPPLPHRRNSLIVQRLCVFLSRASLIFG